MIVHVSLQIQEFAGPRFHSLVQNSHYQRYNSQITNIIKQSAFCFNTFHRGSEKCEGTELGGILGKEKKVCKKK